MVRGHQPTGEWGSNRRRIPKTLDIEMEKAHTCRRLIRHAMLLEIFTWKLRARIRPIERIIQNLKLPGESFGLLDVRIMRRRYKHIIISIDTHCYTAPNYVSLNVI